jgi:hypothetical protein
MEQISKKTPIPARASPLHLVYDCESLTKKGEFVCVIFGLVVAYRFRSIRMIISPIITIAITAVDPKPNTYKSVIGAGVGVGGGVA